MLFGNSTRSRFHANCKPNHLNMLAEPFSRLQFSRHVGGARAFACSLLLWGSGRLSGSCALGSLTVQSLSESKWFCHAPAGCMVRVWVSVALACTAACVCVLSSVCPIFCIRGTVFFSEALESGCVFLVVATTKGSWEQKVAQNRWMLERLALHECMID